MAGASHFYRMQIWSASYATDIFKQCGADTPYKGGTAPRAGIDMEPNGPKDSLSGIVIRNCTAKDNYGGGFTVSFSGLSNASKPLDVAFDACTVDGAGCGSGFSAQTWHRSGAAPAGSRVTWRGGQITNTKNPGLQFSVPATAVQIDVSDLQLGPRTAYGSAGRGWPTISIVAERHNDAHNPIGGVNFKNVSVIDDEARAFLNVAANATSDGGTFAVSNPHGCHVEPAVSNTSSTANFSWTCNAIYDNSGRDT
jgi:hypothetical protein